VREIESFAGRTLLDDERIAGVDGYVSTSSAGGACR